MKSRQPLVRVTLGYCFRFRVFVSVLFSFGILEQLDLLDAVGCAFRRDMKTRVLVCVGHTPSYQVFVRV